MKILMLPTWFGGIGWWRFQVPAKVLRNAGHEVFCPTADQLNFELAKRHNNPFAWLEEEIPKYDLVHAGYSADPTLSIALFNSRDKFNVPVIIDIDDDIDHVPTYNKGWATFYPGSRGQKTVKTQLNYADGVTFSTIPLANTLKYLTKHNKSIVLENWIDVDSWDFPTPPERQKDKSIRLMITGGNGRYGDWEIFKEPIEWAMKKYDGTDGKPLLRLFFIGGTPDWVLPYIESKNDPTKNRVFYIHPTSSVPLFNKLVRYVSPDIILSPTQKNEFNRSKSGLKFLEASLVGAVFVCTDFDTYSNAPDDCCIKVDNTFTQWQGAIGELIENVELRSKLANKAKSYVLDYCDAKDHITPRLEFYQSVLEDYKCRMSQPVVQGQEATLVPDKP